MKNLIFTIVAALLVAVSSSAGDSTGFGNGGDPVEQEFSVLRELAINEALASTLIDDNIKAQLQNTLNATLLATDEILKDRNGRTKTALNLPNKWLILIYRERWNSIKRVELKKALALHECLGLIGIEIDNYALSSAILGLNENDLLALDSDTPLLWEWYLIDGGVAFAVPVTLAPNNIRLKFLQPFDYPRGNNSTSMEFIKSQKPGSYTRKGGDWPMQNELNVANDKSGFEIKIDYGGFFRRRINRFTYSKYSENRFNRDKAESIKMVESAILALDNLRTNIRNECLWDVELHQQTTSFDVKKTMYYSICVYQYTRAAIDEIYNPYSLDHYLTIGTKTAYSFEWDLASPMGNCKQVEYKSGGLEMRFCSVLPFESKVQGAHNLLTEAKAYYENLDYRSLFAE